VTWERPFDQPVPLPNSPPARTLRDAANHIRKLPALERKTPERRLAIQMLIGAAEDRAPVIIFRRGAFLFSATLDAGYWRDQQQKVRAHP
jgi:hypothetical protein